MLVANIVVILLFIILGIVFANGKGANLIAGYNTSSEQAKAKFDKKALCACMAKMMFGLAGSWVVLSIGLQTEMKWLYGTGFALVFGVIVFSLIYMNTGNRLKNKN